MGIPIEPRLSAAALCKRQRFISPSSPTSPTPSLDHPFPFLRSRSMSPVNRRSFGLDRASIGAMMTYYEAYARRRPNNPRKGRLVLVRTLLPRPVRVRRSVFTRLGTRDSRLRMLSRHGTATGGQRVSAAEREELHGEISRFHRRMQARTGGTADDTLDADFARFEARIRFAARGGDDGDMLSVGRLLDREMREEAENDELLHVPAGDPEGDRTPLTSIGISIMYAEDGDPETARVWELGCWAGAHRLAGMDMFQVFLDVLTEATCIPACPIEALCIRDDLEGCAAVKEGIDLLKDLSAELHVSYDRGSSYFLHPITGSPIEIVVER